MSGPRRLAIFLSSVWIGLVFVAYLIDGLPVRWDGVFMLGIVPTAFAWGVWWVWLGFRRAKAEP